MPIAKAINSYVNQAGETKPIDIYYTIEGPEDGEVILYCVGLGCQLVHSMYNTFVAPLVAKGYRVIRFDNRDTGHSTRLSDMQHHTFLAERIRARLSDQNPKHRLDYPLNKKDPFLKSIHSLPEDMAESDYPIVAGTRPIDFMDTKNEHPHRAQFPFMENKGFWNAVGLGKQKPTYELSDIAMDAVLLMNYLNVDKFHVHGVSMGGMVATYIASLIPSRISSLSLVMTTTGNTNHNASMKFLLNAFILRKAPPADAPVETWIKFSYETQSIIGMNEPDRTYNNNRPFESIATSIIRRVPRDENAMLRQMETIDGQESRDKILDFLAVRMPILIFHGKQDQLVPTSNAPHMFTIATESLKRQMNQHVEDGDNNDGEDKKKEKKTEKTEQVVIEPQKVISPHDDRFEAVTVIGNKYQNRQIFTTLAMLDKAAHDITDDYCSYMMSQMLAFYDNAMGRTDPTVPQVLSITDIQWGEQDDLCYGLDPIVVVQTTATDDAAAPTTAVAGQEAVVVDQEQDDVVIVDKPVEDKVESIPVEKNAEKNAETTPPVEEKKAETTPVEEKKAETTPVEEKKAETTPVEEKKAKTTPVEEATPVQDKVTQPQETAVEA